MGCFIGAALSLLGGAMGDGFTSQALPPTRALKHGSLAEVNGSIEAVPPASVPLAHPPY